MWVLAIETATDLVGAALADEGGCRASSWSVGRRRHAETLAPAIVHVCGNVGIDLDQLDALVVDNGPGLFTGLRVGVATANGLAQSLGLEILEVSSLEVLALAATGSAPEDSVGPAVGVGPVLSVVDARRGEVFAARYVRGGAGGSAVAGRVVPEHEPRLYRPEELADELTDQWCSQQRSPGEASGASPRMLAVGDGALRYREVLAKVPGLAIGPGELAHPSPSVMATWAAAVLGPGRGASGGPAERVHTTSRSVPVYLRDADVRIGWARRDPVAP